MDHSPESAIAPDQVTAEAIHKRVSRRTAMRTAIGAAAGAIAAAMVGSSSASAAQDGQPLLIGNPNTAGNVTTLGRDYFKTSVSLSRYDQAVGATCDENDGTAIQATARGTNGLAVNAFTGGHHSQTAVLADTTRNAGEGISVKAVTHNGVSVWAECTGGEALHVVGVTSFSRSGRDQFYQGQVSTTHSGYRLTTDSIVLATIQGNVAGVSVKGVTVNFEQQFFTIRLTKPAPKNLVVGWFLVN